MLCSNPETGVHYCLPETQGLSNHNKNFIDFLNSFFQPMHHCKPAVLFSVVVTQQYKKKLEEEDVDAFTISHTVLSPLKISSSSVNKFMQNDFFFLFRKTTILLYATLTPFSWNQRGRRLNVNADCRAVDCFCFPPTPTGNNRLFSSGVLQNICTISFTKCQVIVQTDRLNSQMQPSFYLFQKQTCSLF